MTSKVIFTKELPALPGNCLPIPFVRAEVRDAHGQIGWVVETHVVARLDLDGHGSPVVLVPSNHHDLNQYSMWWRLFIQRGSCGHELGIIIGMGDPVMGSGESHGLRNFTMVESASPDLAEDLLQGIGSTTYIFDGRRYVGTSTNYR